VKSEKRDGARKRGSIVHFRQWPALKYEKPGTVGHFIFIFYNFSRDFYSTFIDNCKMILIGILLYINHLNNKKE
jgi:hypothetical protein